MSQAMPLAGMQSLFAGAITRPVEIGAQPDGPKVTPTFVAGNSRLSPIAQLEIYREQFWLRHVGALEEDYATLHHLLGHDAFQTLVERYLEAHPPTDFSLRDLGAKLPAFVATHEVYRGDALIADCARIEWAFVEAFDAPDTGPLDPSAIASMPEEAWPAARLTLHPSVHRVPMTHRAHDYRAAVRANEDAPRPDKSVIHVVVYRGPETLQYIEVEPLAFALLERLANGEPLGDACEALATDAENEAELEAKVGGWFQQWAAFGWISAITV